MTHGTAPSQIQSEYARRAQELAWSFLQIVSADRLASFEEWPGTDHDGERFVAARFLLKVDDPTFMEALPSGLRNDVLRRIGELCAFLHPRNNQRSKRGHVLH